MSQHRMKFSNKTWKFSKNFFSFIIIIKKVSLKIVIVIYDLDNFDLITVYFKDILKMIKDLKDMI